MSTPPRTTTSDARSVPHSTPMSVSSAQQSETVLNSQDWLLQTLATELHHATYESKSTIEKICPPSDDTVTAVLELLESQMITPESLKYRDTGLESGASASSEAIPNAELCAWPKKGSGETRYYVPFAWLLNQVCDAFRNHRKGSPSYYKHLRFFVYDRVMKHAIGNASALKPDIVGNNLPALPKKESLPWSQVQIPVEVKDNWPGLVKQAATYARAIFATFDNRRFVLVINYNQGSNEVRFCFYHRAGLISSLPFILDDPGGFKAFVGAMVGIMSWTTADTAGIDTTRTNSMIALPTIGLHRITQSLCLRNNVRGRATRVYVVEKESTKQDYLEPPKHKKHRYDLQTTIRQPTSAPKGPQRRRRRANKTTRESRTSAKQGSTSASSHQSKRPKLSHETLSLGHHPVSGGSSTHVAGHVLQPDESEEIIAILESFTPSTEQKVDSLNSAVPHTLIVKDSYPLLSQCNEGKMFESVKGQFGVPEILAEYVVQDGRGIEDRTSNLLPGDPQYWKIFKSPEPPNGLESRVHMRLIYNTRGFSLCHAHGPHQVLQSILDAMAGHWNLFKAGWLHRDVSVGNVLGLSEKVERPAVTDFDVTKDRTECTGMLIDGDQAVRWKDAEREVGSRRSGTLPFIAYRLVKSWNEDEPDLHTALDDLESFVWVLIWIILLVSESKHALNKSESEWLLSLDDKSLRVLALFKSSFQRQLDEAKSIENLTAGLVVFAPLLSKWLGIAERASVQIRRVLSKTPALDLQYLETTTKEYFKQYMIAGYEALSTLSRESWDQTFAKPSMAT